VASYWVDELSVERNVERRTVGALPIPDKTVLEELGRLGARLVAAAEAGDRKSYAGILASAEAATFDGYQLPPEVREKIISRFEGRPDASGVERYHPSTSATVEMSNRILGSEENLVLRYAGYVRDVSRTMVRLVIPGMTSLDGQWMTVPRKMPGYLCRRDATFEITGDLSDADGLDWNFQELAWTASEVLDSLL
jgi:hypothetical protein